MINKITGPNKGPTQHSMGVTGMSVAGNRSMLILPLSGLDEWMNVDKSNEVTTSCEV